jgi:hypothetical protein
LCTFECVQAGKIELITFADLKSGLFHEQERLTRMVIPPQKSDEDELSYEDFDDAAWVDDELDTIDLDALDADIPGEEGDTAPDQPVPDQAAASLLETIDTLDDDLAPAVEDEETPPQPAQAVEALPIEESPAPSEHEPPEASPAPAETPAETVAAPDQAMPDQAAASLLETVGTLDDDLAPAVEDEEPPPQPAAELAPEPAIEPAPEIVPSAEPTAEAEPPPQPVIPPDVYCVLLPLPPELASQVIELRKTGEITTMPPPGIVLTVQFRTVDLPGVEAALAKWTRAHLPFQFETVGVSAKVIGAQQYVAAWTLEPEEEIVEAQHALRQALADVILPLPGATTDFSAYVPIGEQIAAPRYAQVIGQMQRAFEPFVWRANDLQLVCQGEQPDQWATVRSFD